MPSMKLIKRRIESVSGTQQIMKAMDLVATSKLQKAKTRLNAIRPMYSEAKRIMGHVRPDDLDMENIFVTRRDGKNIAYIVITSDRGLCGGYNTNIAKKAFTHMNETVTADQTEQVIAVGMKGWDYLRRRDKNVVKRFRAVTESADFSEAERVGSHVLDLFAHKDADKAVQEVYIAYTHFETMLTHVPTVARILPLSQDEDGPKTGKPMHFEPDADTFLQQAIPMYVKVFIYGAMMESAACEQAARMMSMDAAAKNAEDIIDDLTLAYNRKRQGIITQEINEIVSGANALQ